MPINLLLSSTIYYIGRINFSRFVRFIDIAFEVTWHTRYQIHLNASNTGHDTNLTKIIVDGQLDTFDTYRSRFSGNDWYYTDEESAQRSADDPADHLLLDDYWKPYPWNNLSRQSLDQANGFITYDNPWLNLLLFKQIDIERLDNGTYDLCFTSSAGLFNRRMISQAKGYFHNPQ